MSRDTPELYVLLSGATSTGAGSAVQPRVYRTVRTFHVLETGSADITATVKIQGSNDNSDWQDLATFSIDDSTSASGGVTIENAWRFIRANLSAITGTAATVTVYGSW